MEAARLRLKQDILEFVKSNVVIGIAIVNTSHDFFSSAGDFLTLHTADGQTAMVLNQTDITELLDIGLSSSDGRIVRLSSSGEALLGQEGDPEAYAMFKKLEKRFSP